ncbi:MAG: hypothetical protein ABIQ15_13770 [Nocardioides sp.]
MAGSPAFSVAYTAGLGGLMAALGAVGLLLTGERHAGLPGALEVTALLASAVALAAAGFGAGAATDAGWPRLLGVAAVVVLLVLAFLTLASPDRGSVLLFEVVAVALGGLFLVQLTRN